MNRPEPAKLDAESNRTMTICNMNIIYKLKGLFWRSLGSFFFPGVYLNRVLLTFAHMPLMHILNARYVFNDGLLYEDRNWQYVSQGDRRFYTEVKEGAFAALIWWGWGILMGQWGYTGDGMWSKRGWDIVPLDIWILKMETLTMKMRIFYQKFILKGLSEASHTIKGNPKYSTFTIFLKLSCECH